jgi:hypothetical protein
MSKWQNWQPRQQKRETSKPSKLGSEGFDGSSYADIPKIRTSPSVEGDSLEELVDILDNNRNNSHLYKTIKTSEDHIFGMRGEGVPSKPSKPPSEDDGEPSPFQLLFFDQLEALTARRRGVLLEQGRRAGIPREAAEAFWRTKRKSAQTPEAA